MREKYAPQSITESNEINEKPKPSGRAREKERDRDSERVWHKQSTHRMRNGQ